MYWGSGWLIEIRTWVGDDSLLSSYRCSLPHIYNTLHFSLHPLPQRQEPKDLALHTTTPHLPAQLQPNPLPQSHAHLLVSEYSLLSLFRKLDRSLRARQRMKTMWQQTCVKLSWALIQYSMFSCLVLLIPESVDQQVKCSCYCIFHVTLPCHIFQSFVIKISNCNYLLISWWISLKLELHTVLYIILMPDT